MGEHNNASPRANIVNMPTPRRPVPDGYTEVRKGSMPSATRKAVHAGELAGFIIERRLCVKTDEHLAWIERTRRVQPRTASVESTDPRGSVVFGKRRAS